jgi:hypothetical protein
MMGWGTGDLRPHTRDDLNTKLAPVTFCAGARSATLRHGARPRSAFRPQRLRPSGRTMSRALRGPSQQRDRELGRLLRNERAVGMSGFAALPYSRLAIDGSKGAPRSGTRGWELLPRLSNYRLTVAR